MKSYYVYILECSDKSYYTGMTDNLERRMSEHKSGINKQCYTYSKRPVKLIFYEVSQSPSDAIRLEKKLKGWSRKKKEAFIKKDWQRLIEYSKSHPSTSSG